MHNCSFVATSAGSRKPGWDAGFDFSDDFKAIVAKPEPPYKEPFGCATVLTGHVDNPVIMQNQRVTNSTILPGIVPGCELTDTSFHCPAK